MIVVFAVLLVILAGLLTLVSYVERVYAERGKLLSREFEDNVQSYEQRVEPKLGVSSERAALSMQVLAQLITGGSALLVGYAVFKDGRWSAGEIVQGLVVIALTVIVFNRLLPYICFIRTKGYWLESMVPVLRLLIWLALPITILLGFSMSVVSLSEEHEPEENEDSSEAVEALLEAGTEEGILEEGDRELIHSVVEFGDKTVREVMTARPDIVAVSASTTIEELTDLLQHKPHSRIPVFDPDIDHIRGVVFSHDVLQVRDVDARTQTVARLMRPVHFVPEIKRVSELLREMQKDKVQIAIAVDEYGGVAGLVTLEDMLEEIVGDISDEHERHSDVVRENDTTYILSGATSVDALEELFEVRAENTDATTVAGLLSEVAGHIPRPGEIVEYEGLKFEVLDSTDRRVERLRVAKLVPQPQRSGAV